MVKTADDKKNKLLVSEGRLLSSKQVKEMWGVSHKWLWVHTLKGRESERIPSFKLGKVRRYRADELAWWLEKHKE